MRGHAPTRPTLQQGILQRVVVDEPGGVAGISIDSLPSERAPQPALKWLGQRSPFFYPLGIDRHHWAIRCDSQAAAAPLSYFFLRFLVFLRGACRSSRWIASVIRFAAARPAPSDR